MSGGSRKKIVEKHATISVTGLDAKDGTKRLKVISAGDAAVGKSCLIKRFCEDFGVKPALVEGKPVRVNFWDLSGHPSFGEARVEFYRDTEAVLLVFDLSEEESFRGLETWLEEMKSNGLPKWAVIVLIGNKADKARRAVDEREARAFASDHKLEYFETSAENGANVEKAFHALFSRAMASSMRASGGRG